MTEVGESVAPTTITVDEVEENHFAGIFICYPNGKPFNDQITFGATVDGNEISGMTNFEAQAVFTMLEPGASVEICLQEESVETEQSGAREEIKALLDQIITDERNQQAIQNTILDEASWIDRKLIITGAFMTGVGEGVVGLVEFAGDALETTGKVLWFNLQSQTNVLEAGWTKYVEGDEKAFFEVLEEKYVEDFANAFGITPKQMADNVKNAYEIWKFVMDDPELQEMLLQFAVDYGTSQSTTEYVSMAGSAAFDIILSAILAATTGGAGNVAQIAAKVRHASKFRSLGRMLAKFTKRGKKQRLPKKTTGKLDEITEVKYEAPKGQALEAKAPPDDAFKKNKDKKKNQDEEGEGKKEAESDNAEGKQDGEGASNTNEQTGTNESGKTTPETAKTKTGGEPVSLVTGEELLELTDFSFQGPVSLAWKRTYRSSNPHNIGLGHGWTHPFSERIEFNEKEIQLHDSEGRIITFNTPRIGQSTTNTAEALRVHRQSLTSFIVKPSGPGLYIERHFEAIASNTTLNLNRIKDAFNNAVDLHYKDNRIISIESQSDRWSLSYDGRRNLTGITWQTSQGKSKVLARYSYDEKDDLIGAEDSVGNAEHYAYNHHLIAKRTLKSGYSFYFKWDGTTSKARCIQNWGDKINGKPTYNYTFQWDVENKRVAVTDTRGGIALHQFNERGLPSYTRDQEGGETREEYDALGNLTKVTDASGNVERFYYSADNLLQSAVNKSGSKQDFIRDSQGNITQVIDPLGQSWKRKYNPHGQVSSQTNPNGESTQYQYNSMGLVNTITDPLKRQWHYVWDNIGRLLAIKNPQGQHTRYTYSEFGELQRITWPDGQKTDYRYDANGNCTAIKQPDGKVEQFTYSKLGLLTQHKDSAGRITRYQYNGLSQVVRRVDPTGQSLDYQYDGERNLIGLTNEKAEQYQLTYDLNEQLVQEVGFDGRVQRYAYNSVGHLLSSEDYSVDGKTLLNQIAYTRDIDGRLLKQIDGRKNDLLNEFKYDVSGRLLSAKNPQRKLQWRYDKVGRVIEDHQDQHVTTHSYDAAGQRNGTRLPNGEQVDYHYDVSGAFSGLDYKGQRVAEIQRDAMGRELQRSLSNALTTEHRYDPQGRLVAQRTGKVDSDKPFKAISQRRYQYNKEGQLSQIDDQIRGATKYHYDALDRLTQVEGPNPEAFVHDPAGNILSSSGSNSSDNENTSSAPQADSPQVKGNRLAFFGDTHYQYDHLGNRVGQARGKNQSIKSTYRYNALNQLTDVMHNNVHTHYIYDPLGRRIAKRNAQNRTDFLWLEDVLLSETTKSQQEESAHEKTYLFEPGSFKPLAFVENEEIYHYHLDHLGTPQEITNAQGEVVWAVSFKAYGNLAVAYRNQVENNLRFQGQYFDVESGLHYNRFRYYDPSCGRFINQDPVGILGGLNSYQYVTNPTQWIDPFGLTAKKESATRQTEAVQQSKPDFYVGPSGPSSTMPSTGYRYDRHLNDDGTPNEWGQKMLENKEGQVTYMGFEKYDTGAVAGDAFQIKLKKHVNQLNPSDSSWSDARLRGEFDTLQLYDEAGVPKVRVPREFGDKLGAAPEPLTKAYPEFGKGGAQQLHADRMNVKFDKVDILPEK